MKGFMVTIGSIIVGIFLFTFLTGQGFGPGKDESLQGQVTRISTESVAELRDIQP